MDSTQLDIDIFLDDPANILKYAGDMRIIGFTTNPSLLCRAGVTDYEQFAKEILAFVCDKPVSLEVMSDDFKEMHRQALIIQSWGGNVNVKIPITNTKGESSIPLIIDLVNQGVTVNVTAVTTIKQAYPVLQVLKNAKDGYLSLFSGRIADCGVDPIPVMEKLVYLKNDVCPQIKLIWASAREIFNVIQADRCGCDIITINADLLKKYSMLGTDLLEISQQTVQMFYNDAQAAGYKI